MHVAALTAYHVRIPLRRTVRHASHARTSTDNLLVRCRLADGTIGWGEGVPRDYVTGETIDSSLATLVNTEWRGQFSECSSFADAVLQVEQFTLPESQPDPRRIAGHAARCAVELACLDAFGRQYGQPLSEVTRLVAPELHRSQSRVQYSGAITSSDGLKLKLVALAYRFYGFSQVKLKVGISGQNDLRRLSALRRRLGAGVRIRVDANEAWTPDQAAARIGDMTPFGVESVEQPVAHEHVGCLNAARKQVPIPIMLDESLCSMTDAERAVHEGLCDSFNLRLSKCGGFIRTLRLAQFAHQHGITCQLGCQVGETAILSAAGRHFATSVAGLTAIEGSFDRHLVREALGDRDITFGRAGWASALPEPGLGIGIDASALRRVCLREERLFG